MPVLEGEGRVAGVVSEADLLPKEEFRDSDPARHTQLRRLTDLAQAARTMAHAKVKRLPVVDELGVPQGIVSRTDLLKVFLRGDEEIAEEVRREVVAYLFPAPASAVRVTVGEGVVQLGGRIRDTSLVPVAARLIRAVEGVVDVEFDLTGHGRSSG